MASYPLVEFEAIGVESLLQVLEFMTAREASWLRAHPEISHPYDASVRYEKEPKGSERWQRIATTLALGRGDCEDLAVYLAAWYRARKGLNAKVAIKRFEKRGVVWYHAIVQMPDGHFEDPSKELGM